MFKHIHINEGNIEFNMPTSVIMLKSEEIIKDEHLEKMKEYYEGEKDDPTIISKSKGSITENSQEYYVFEVAKRIHETRQDYKIDENKDIIVPCEEDFEYWNTVSVYIGRNSKYIYVRGAFSGWIMNIISNILFGVQGNIKKRAIATDRIEEDIRRSSKFQCSGTSFEDTDGTKLTLKNLSGIDLDTHYITKDKNGIEKNRIEIIVEKDDLNFDILVYPEGKVTFPGRPRYHSTMFRIFLRIWSEIEDYS